MAGLLFLAGCYPYSSWSPTVDPYGDPDAEHIPADLDECRQLALQASGDPAGQAVGGATVGGLLGAATGAAIGAAFGDPGAGAAAGAAFGGVSGLTQGALVSQDIYRRAFWRCMEGRGHRVLG
jgi:uncharacterized protein YcfJ